MPDTHDERGGDEAAMLLAIRRRALTASTYAEWHQVGRDIETLVEQLAAATARAEKAEALVAELGEPEVEQRMISPSGLVYEPTLRDLENQDYWLPGVRLEERQVYPTPWRVAADAAQDGRSGSVERSETSQGSADASTPVRASAGLSEPEPPRDPSAWCWAPNPAGRLHCGRLHDHEPPHRRGERTWTDDDTEAPDA